MTCPLLRDDWGWTLCPLVVMCSVTLKSVVGRSATWPTQCRVLHCYKGQVCWTFLSKCLSHKHSLSLFPGRTDLATGYVSSVEGCLTEPRRDGVYPHSPERLGTLLVLLC